MEKRHRKEWGGALLALLAFCSVADAQVPQVTITAPSNVSDPLLLLQDFSGDSGVYPLFELVGGLNAKTVGIEVTSQSGSTAGVLPNLGTIMGSGFGGLSLVQTNGAAMGAGASSPFLSMCAQQFDSTNGTGAACWSWQVQGGNGSDPPDVLKLTRSNATNPTQDITVLFPAMINLATGPTGAGIAGQITVGPAPISGTNASVPSTFTGAGTSSSSTMTAASAGPVTVEPGQLLGSPLPTSVEGALQILQSYFGTNNSGANYGRLACPDSGTPTTQGVVPCTVAGQAESWVGVYNSIPGQSDMLPTPGASITPLRYGRVLVKSMQSGSAGAWTVGQFACKDDINPSYVVNNMSVPCNAGESIGIAVGDPSGTTNMHLVDLIPEASVQGGTMLTFFCSSGVTGGATMYLFPGALNPACALATTAGEMQPVSFSGTIRNLVVFYTTPPGAGMNRTDTFTVYKCPALAGCAATSVKCQVTTGATTPSTCSDLTDSVAVAQGDGIQIVDVAGTSSTAASPRVTIQIQ